MNLKNSWEHKPAKAPEPSEIIYIFARFLFPDWVASCSDDYLQ